MDQDGPGANAIKLATPRTKFWSWRNYEKSLFQSYKTTLVLKITTNFGVNPTLKFVRRQIGIIYAKKCLFSPKDVL